MQRGQPLAVAFTAHLEPDGAVRRGLGDFARGRIDKVPAQKRLVDRRGVGPDPRGLAIAQRGRLRPAVGLDITPPPITIGGVGGADVGADVGRNGLAGRLADRAVLRPDGGAERTQRQCVSHPGVSRGGGDRRRLNRSRGRRCVDNRGRGCRRRHAGARRRRQQGAGGRRFGRIRDGRRRRWGRRVGGRRLWCLCRRLRGRGAGMYPARTLGPLGRHLPRAVRNYFFVGAVFIPQPRHILDRPVGVGPVRDIKPQPAEFLLDPRLAGQLAAANLAAFRPTGLVKVRVPALQGHPIHGQNFGLRSLLNNDGFGGDARRHDRDLNHRRRILRADGPGANHHGQQPGEHQTDGQPGRRGLTIKTLHD